MKRKCAAEYTQPTEIMVFSAKSDRTRKRKSEKRLESDVYIYMLLGAADEETDVKI